MNEMVNFERSKSFLIKNTNLHQLNWKNWVLMDLPKKLKRQ